jgi:hypothetical protein
MLIFLFSNVNIFNLIDINNFPCQEYRQIFLISKVLFKNSLNLTIATLMIRIQLLFVLTPTVKIEV